MLRIIEARTDSGLEGLLRVITTLRRRTFDIVDVGMVSTSKEARLKIVICEKPDRSGLMAVDYIKQLYEIHDVHLKENDALENGRALT